MIIWLTEDQRGLVLRPINGRGGFQSLLRRIQRSYNPELHTVTVTKADLAVILREIGRGPRGGFQKRLAALEPEPDILKVDLRRTPLRVKRA